MQALEVHIAHHRPRALAALTRQFRDLDLAEDAFGEACLRALRRWPETGVPDDPFAWLLTVARNAGIDQIRRNTRPPDAADSPDPQPHEEEDMRIADLDQAGLRDDVLRLLFICCHPALARQDQLALALRVVAGLHLDEVARAFLVRPRAMEQRLTRAKRTIAAHPVPFDPPDMLERHRRLGEVSLMVYLMFNEGWSTSASDEQIKLPLCEEAIRLARLLLALFPAMAELMGLLALLLFQHARRKARIGPDGALLTLDRQDRGTWDRPMMAEARSLLDKAARHGPAGPYQLQAMIAGVHARAASDAETDWALIERHYGALHALQPTPVIRLNQAAALSRTRGPLAALAMIAPLEADLAGYRWFHMMRGELLMELGDHAAAHAALRTAEALDPTAPERRVIAEKIAECEKNL